MRQLTGVDASFLAWEGPTTTGHVTGVLMLDPSTSPSTWTFERFGAMLRSRLDRLEPLTLKLMAVPLGLDRPYWVRDPAFDVENHLHYVAVPGDGDREAFAALVTSIHERPLDRRQPLWECHVVDGVPGGLKAVIAKIHHAAVDGLSGQEILAGLVDLEPLDVALVDADTSPPLPRGHRSPGPADLLARAALSMATSPVRAARLAGALARSLPVLGATLGPHGPAARGDETAAELVRRHGSAPPTPFNAAIGPHRRWAYTSLPLREVKAVKDAAGCTVNDVVLAVVAGVLRRWLLDHEALPDRPLVAMVPLSVRREGQQNSVGNFITPTVCTLATHLDDPARRLAAISDGMATAKRHNSALPADILTDLTQVAPPAIAALAARLVASTRLADRLSLPFNLVVSNVPGPPIPLYLAGALIVGHYPVSTIVDGVGLNVTVMSTNGMLDFGFVADRELVPDLWSMADGVRAALDELAGGTS